MLPSFARRAACVLAAMASAACAVPCATLQLRGGGYRKRTAAGDRGAGDAGLMQSMRTGAPASPLAREAPPDAAKAQTRPQEVVYRCLYTNRPGHSRAHQRWQDGLLIVTDGRSCGLVTEDKENVLCRGEPLREPVIDGAEIKVRSWTVHVTERVVPEGEEAAEDGPTQTTEVP